MRALDESVFIRRHVEMHGVIIGFGHFAEFVVSIETRQTENQRAARARHIASGQNIF